jgi:hypothetical protein
VRCQKLLLFFFLLIPAFHYLFFSLACLKTNRHSSLFASTQKTYIDTLISIFVKGIRACVCETENEIRLNIVYSVHININFYLMQNILLRSREQNYIISCLYEDQSHSLGFSTIVNLCLVTKKEVCV